VRDAFAGIVTDTDRARDVVDRIGALVKKAPPRKESLDLNEAILEVTALTHSEAIKTRARCARNWRLACRASKPIGFNCNK
jgi:nitrogen-specific signal transduction histidine kinase